ncbi:MAG: ATP-binding cassette domain-containing protein [Bacteroidetes bacterium]|nr:ATP-binding cassette domain-containing protein [Bacteroidota bacterium]
MTETGEPVVSVKNTSVSHDGNTVLTDVSFDIAGGEFVFLVGRTGSGKSSLLKTLYADHQPDSGEIRVAGYRLEKIRRAEIPHLRRKVGIVFQDFQLFPDRSISENMMFVMKATGWEDGMKMKTRVAEVLMQVGLGSSDKKLPHQLSGGEQQRAAIARALINQPLILIADEPTGNLDPGVASEILKLFQQINKDGTAVLMATHSYGLIRKNPARILRCLNGKLQDSNLEQIELIAEEEL